ncbi:MAG: PEP-CTERM sorting domain-containing protein [Fimbriimonas sp.]
MNRYLLSLGILSLSAFAAADNIKAKIHTSFDIENVLFALAYDSSSLFGPGALSYDFHYITNKVTPTITAGSTFDVDYSFNNTFALPVISYTVFATYNGGTGGSIAFDPTAATSLEGNPWPLEAWTGWITEQRFLESFAAINPGGYDNADIWNASYRSMLNNSVAPSATGDATLVNYSNGVNGGSVSNFVYTPTAVPEPASLMAVAFGVAGMMRLRKSNKRA